MLQTGVLDLEKPIRRFDSRPNAIVVIHPTELTSTAKKTRILLQHAFYKRFFRRYIDRKYITKGSFVFEMQQLMHPAVKHAGGGPMDTIIGVVAEQQRITPAEISRHVARVRSAIIDRIKRVMKQVAEEQEPQTTRQAAPVAPPRLTDSLFNADVMNAFTIRQAPPPVRAQDIMDTRIDEEVETWFEDQSVLEVRDGRPESVLQYWKRQYEIKSYRFLPLVAKIVFAVPSSSAQIERVFGNSGQTVTALRSSTSSHNIDMCSFLSQNRRFVNVCQCPKLQHHEVSAHIPSKVTINLDPETEGRVDWGTITQECFSLSLSDTEGGA